MPNNASAKNIPSVPSDLCVSRPPGLALTNIAYDKLPVDPLFDDQSRYVEFACCSYVLPKTTRCASLLLYSQELGQKLGLGVDTLTSDDFLKVISGNGVYEGVKPFAYCYGGHQFGRWAGQLGDGRAINLGEINTPTNGRWAMQLKGAGVTPYSRHADGLAVFRSSLREFLCSEAMHYLGVPTTRALSLALSGDLVERDMFYDGNRQMERGAIVCRVAPSFLRFGSFEIFAARGDKKTLEALLDFTVENEFPHLFALYQKDKAQGALAMFDEVANTTVHMIVQWMRVGFVHGVMNTDNMSILGLTIDYGPYGWLENFDPGWTPNTTDAQQQRYRFGNQAAVAQWNLLQLANALYPIINDAKALECIVADFATRYDEAWSGMMGQKLGIKDATIQDMPLFVELESLMHKSEMDMTLFYRKLAQVKKEYLAHTLFFSDKALTRHCLKEFLSVSYVQSFDDEVSTLLLSWLKKYQVRCMAHPNGVKDSANKEDSLVHGHRSANQRVVENSVDLDAQIDLMNKTNPVMVLRNYLVQEAINMSNEGDNSRMYALFDALKSPYDQDRVPQAFTQMRPSWALNKAGCSKLSCSS